MMTYEDGYQNGLKIALMAIHKVQYDSKKAEFLEAVINSAIAESEKRQEKYLKEMEKIQNERD